MCAIPKPVTAVVVCMGCHNHTRGLELKKFLSHGFGGQMSKVKVLTGNFEQKTPKSQIRRGVVCKRQKYVVKDGGREI